jgi:ElaB/YqjD/DUF883 family membrane-anchored ribosome-binding protein
MEQQRGQNVGSNNGGGAGSSALSDEAQRQLDELRQRVGEINERVVAFIKERPGTSILIAAGVGYLVGRILRS